MNLNFKIFPCHLDLIRATVKKFGHCYFFGDGNLYTDDFDVRGNKLQDDMQSHFFHKNHSPLENEAATFMLYFSNINEVPDNVEKLKELFIKVKSTEYFNQKSENVNIGTKSISIEEDTEEIEKSKKQQKKLK